MALTNKEFFTKIIEGARGSEIEEKARELLTALEKIDEKKQERNAAAKAADAPKLHAIRVFLMGKKNVLAKDIATAIGESPQKTTYLLRTLAEKGDIERIEPSNRHQPLEYSLTKTGEEIMGGAIEEISDETSAE